ncbi:MAG: hypothetical protein ACRYG7_15785 [Janthinobacterium lividum]
MPIPIEIDLPDGDWICRWINDLRYKEEKDGILCNSQVAYVNPDGELLRSYSSVHTLFMTIPGSRLTVRNYIVRKFLNNSANTDTHPAYIFDITEQDLNKLSRRIYRSLGFSGEEYKSARTDELFSNMVLRRLSLPNDFAYSHAHCIPNTNSAYPVDFFLIPSYEIIRYFFLHSSTLSEDLLSYFTGIGERSTRSLKELYAHPTGKPAIDQQGPLSIASLLVKAGLREQEVNCLARIAFIQQAYDCLEVVKDALLLRSLGEAEYAYQKIRTILPQDKPFKVKACGKPFTWKDKRYVMIDQIYGVQEQMPFDQVLYAPFVDYRSQTTLTIDGKQVVNKRSAPRTKPAPDFRITSNQPGDLARPADILAMLETDNTFEPLPLPIKINKTGQTDRYQTVSGHYIEQQLISTIQQGQTEINAGRGRLHRQDTKRHAATSSRATTLFDALKHLRDYKCFYFNLDGHVPSFSLQYHLNKQQGTNRPFDILLCRLEPNGSTTRESIYLLWANNIRYALFYAPLLRSLSWEWLADQCTAHFSKEGVYASSFPKTKLRDYSLHNQLQKDAYQLANKISGELDDILDDNKR